MDIVTPRSALLPLLHRAAFDAGFNHKPWSSVCKSNRYPQLKYGDWSLIMDSYYAGVSAGMKRDAERVSKTNN